MPPRAIHCLPDLGEMMRLIVGIGLTIPLHRQEVVGAIGEEHRLIVGCVHDDRPHQILGTGEATATAIGHIHADNNVTIVVTDDSPLGVVAGHVGNMDGAVIVRKAAVARKTIFMMIIYLGVATPTGSGAAKRLLLAAAGCDSASSSSRRSGPA